ncbi:hypothetical protein AvCA_07900 [Azotobacter vinelandii CA]|uniref:Uncharacterized protein n=2 Tax=Azotobacter vinelandii TaxID=354 RepID=C1DLT7_AZOVD|nr:hypothetical protein Avin_07900 [Azotobacter vinelandii DJ]AGK15513.1 hypothetical protein AvCA_07900 [Azotobacter vinelandii CA]AGK19515.1 hypothetical protein AvCA6_07900 [Azotobacter vinelandii CA6]
MDGNLCRRHVKIAATLAEPGRGGKRWGL